MKRILFFLMLLIVILASCSSDNSIASVDENVLSLQGKTNVDEQTNIELQKLQSDIRCYNVSVFGQSEKGQTRSFLGWLRKHTIVAKIIVTVLADAVGALGGVTSAVVSSGLVGASCLAGVDEVAVTPITRAVSGENDSIPSISLNTNEIAFSNIVPSCDAAISSSCINDSIGFYHNKALCSVLEDTEKMKDFIAASTNEQAQMIIDAISENESLANYYGEELEDSLGKAKGISVAETIIKLANESDTEEEFMDKLINSGLTGTNIIAVIEEVVDGLMELNPESDDGTYYNEVIKMVLTSELNDEVKSRIIDGVIVGQASNHLWNTSTKSGASESAVY